MTIIWTIIIGFVIGLIARALIPGRDPAGFIITTVLGVAGALVGSLIGRVLGFYGEGEPAGLIMSVIGAIVLLIGYRYLTPSTSASRP
ncbi:MAG: hypothetical protein RL518_2031 [Pseudomonadota bacterium]|jgi:uncharacterized membrane protein YeaQ/YmgE (transglycosylase-associated protein family)